MFSSAAMLYRSYSALKPSRLAPVHGLASVSKKHNRRGVTTAGGKATHATQVSCAKLDAVGGHQCSESRHSVPAMPRALRVKRYALVAMIDRSCVEVKNFAAAEELKFGCDRTHCLTGD
jgi:hypothetical protein